MSRPEVLQKWLVIELARGKPRKTTAKDTKGATEPAPRRPRKPKGEA